MLIYKNVSDQEIVIPNIGVVKSGASISSSHELINSNLKLISDDKKVEVKEEIKSEMTK